MSIAERIKSARISAGLSQQKLGEAIGVSKMAISKYEQGKTIPNSGMLLRIAEALDVRVDYFFRTPAVTLSEPQYRCHKKLLKKDENAIHGKILDWLERYLEIEMITDVQTTLDLPKEEICHAVTMEDVEKVAQMLRDEWALGLDPIENVMDVLEQHGIKVGIVDAPDTFDALTFTYDGKIPVIAVNKNTTGDRQRFNLAHELGHLILQVSGDLDEEKAANRFAGAFLVPREMGINELGEHRNRLFLRELYVLKHKYGLSMKAWIHRAHDLGIISKNQETGLYIELNTYTKNKQEPGKQIRPQLPTHMHQLIFRALGDKKITQSRARELFGGPIPVVGVEE
ncbi:XRE family transcriptional regulator [Methanogenium organophilum]|uniref:XRE family transcriptional regulator n=1 Tax=Methanogenium organophilum TaxID=2199 RepID=A0A9X9T8L9_METOG|nr:XRE family transcriptional regulator [Methanogenium organophilum]WAI02304.1 XRE family transcriptional regulator [Methanogenium organophilum]